MISESERAAQLARIRAREAELAAEREKRTQAIESEAAAYAVEHDLITDDPAYRETPLERWALLGGLSDPMAASRALSDSAKSAGMPRVITYQELDDQRQAEADFYAAGGGRFPGQETPAVQPPRPPRIDATWVDDADVIYDQASLAMIRAARQARPQ